METTDPIQFLTQFEFEVYSKIAKVFVTCNIKFTVNDDLPVDHYQLQRKTYENLRRKCLCMIHDSCINALC